jgi:splicing factor 3B subunit 5
MVNQQRDSYASYIGHRSLLYYMSIAENQPIQRTKYEFLERMARPCGTPPKKEED